jgi:hypothetical protein
MAYKSEHELANKIEMPTVRDLEIIQYDSEKFSSPIICSSDDKQSKIEKKLTSFKNVNIKSNKPKVTNESSEKFKEKTNFINDQNRKFKSTEVGMSIPKSLHSKLGSKSMSTIDLKEFENIHQITQTKQDNKDTGLIIKSSYSNNNLDYKSFNDTFKNENFHNINVSFEKPRTPPVAAQIRIETIAVNSEIDDTFLNDEFTLLDSISSTNTAAQLQKKFTYLPTFISTSQSNVVGHKNEKEIFINDSNNLVDYKFNCNENEITINENNEQEICNDDSQTSKYQQEFYEQNIIDSNRNLTTCNKPKCIKQISNRKKSSTCAKQAYLAPPDKCGLKLR